MVSILGSIFISFALFSDIYSAIAIWVGIKRQDPRWVKSGRRGVYSAAALLLFALILLLIAFIGNQFQINYVAQHSSLDLPLYLKFSAIWAGQEGSLLLWSFLQVLFAAVVGKNKDETGLNLSKWAAVILAIIAAFFIVMTLIFSNPFIASTSAPLDGLGMNPLLRHIGMVLHPPILYVGYVGLAVPFAYALASLITNQVDNWYRDIRGWLLISWFALGVGIILGSRWAYDVLGWGGYWGWDAVENAGLMPWLTATALLHGISRQKKGRGFKVWNISLAAISFWLVLFGTFTTRSGLIQSVHAFANSQIGIYFLMMLGLTLIAVPTMIIGYRKSLGEINYPEKVFSRDGVTFFTLLLLLLITLSILAGTLLPTLTDGRFSAPASWFNRVVGPQFGALVLLMGICPILGRFGRSIKTSKWRVFFPIIGFLLVPVLAASNGMNHVFSLIGFAVAGFAGGIALGELFYLLQLQMKRNKLGSELGNFAIKNRKAYGGLLVHFGIVLIAIGVIGTQVYNTSENITLSPGDLTQIAGYRLVYEDLFQETKADQIDTWVTLSVYRDDTFLTTLEPQIAYYPNYDQAMAEPAIRSSIAEDLYLVFFQWDDSGEISLNVRINPLSSFLWLGGLVLSIGGLIAWWPQAKIQRQKSSQKYQWFRQLGAIVGLGLILVLIVLFWGNPFRTIGKVGRPLPGETAPEISSQDYQGNNFTLADYRGKVIVVHFWASWCPECEGELEMFESVWQGQAEQDTLFVGIAMNDDDRTVGKVAEELGLSFVLIPDKKGDISKSYGVSAVPETFFVDPDGEILCFHIGAMNEDDLEIALETIKGGFE